MQPLAQERIQGADTKTVRTRRIEAILVSSDDSFLIELGPILGDRYRTRTIDHPDEIASATEASRWLAIIDAGNVADARSAVARMEQQYRGAEVIVITSKPEEWSSAVSRGAVIATFARDQLNSPRLLAALAAAETRLSQENNDTEVANGADVRSTGPKYGAPGKGLRTALPLLAVLVIALAATAWWLRRAPQPLAPGRALTAAVGSSTANANTAVTAKPQGVLELLSTARVAFRDQKTLLPRADGEPRGDSALELYIQVLAQQPDNDEAVDGVRRLFAVAKGRIQSDLVAGKLDDAARLLGFFKTAGLDPDMTRDLDTSIAAARPRWLASHAQENIAAGDLVAAQQLLEQMNAAGADRNSISQLQGAIDAKKLQLQLLPMSNAVKAAIDSGALLDPSADNARTRLQAMRSINRSHPLTLAAQRDVQAALLTHAQEASHKEQFDQAQRYMSAAAEIGTSAEITDAKRQLQSEMDSAAQRTAAAAADIKAKEAAASQASAANSSGSANADKANVPHFVMARPAKALHVTYPAAASAGNIQGFVTVEFTLHPDGSATDASVIESQPAKIFDRAATDAITHGHFDTGVLPDGHAARARFRITFKVN